MHEFTSTNDACQGVEGFTKRSGPRGRGGKRDRTRGSNCVRETVERSKYRRGWVSSRGKNAK